MLCHGLPISIKYAVVVPQGVPLFSDLTHLEAKLSFTNSEKTSQEYDLPKLLQKTEFQVKNVKKTFVNELSFSNSPSSVSWGSL